MHRRFGFGLITGHNTARMASSKTVFKPFWVNAEHSKYFTEPISLAIARPCNWHKRKGKGSMECIWFSHSGFNLCIYDWEFKQVLISILKLKRFYVLLKNKRNDAVNKILISRSKETRVDENCKTECNKKCTLTKIEKCEPIYI